MSTLPRLRRAWKHLLTGTNYQHKRFLRSLYDAYGLAADRSLPDLQQRLRARTYEPLPPARIWLPKPSGLQRPITLLHVEDQVVFQALATMFAQRLADKRRPIEHERVFSNVPNGPRSDFFLRRWQSGYGAFVRKVETLYTSGLHWIGHFDLAAFYDTIPHDRLLQTAFPRAGTGEFGEITTGWLGVWSTDRPGQTHGHGIPQGPISSDYLGEAFLLSIDLDLQQRGIPCVRYVDDIRLFGRSEREVQSAVIRLDVLCRDKGLIPQGQKLMIHRASSLQEALGTLPSLAPSRPGKTNRQVIPAPSAVRQFRGALAGRPQKISNRSRARYVLRRAEPSPKMLTYVLRLLHRQPQYIDDFTDYIDRHLRSRRAPRVIQTCAEVLDTTPYEYVAGEMWHRLADHLTPALVAKYKDQAIEVTADREASFARKWGACRFLCVAEAKGHGRLSRWVWYQDSALLQALVVPALPDAALLDKDTVTHLVRRSACEPGVALAKELASRRLDLADVDLSDATVSSQTKHALHALDFIPGSPSLADPIDEILTRRYGTSVWARWRAVFGGEYQHAMRMLRAADAAYATSPSTWLAQQDSFNDALFRAMQVVLTQAKAPGRANLRNRNNELNPYGGFLQPGTPFHRGHPDLANDLRAVHARRSRLPVSHAYDKRSGDPCEWLRRSERRGLRANLASAYTAVAGILDPLIQ
ncbi:hypothetical protein HN766_06700 [Candidatus Poribacteria bacterium]|nr:hypothetical protein [Candidatus Poribacteria bacterium]